MESVAIFGKEDFANIFNFEPDPTNEETKQKVMAKLGDIAREFMRTANDRTFADYNRSDYQELYERLNDANRRVENQFHLALYVARFFGYSNLPETIVQYL